MSPEDLNHIRRGKGVDAPAMCGFPRVEPGMLKEATCNECVARTLDALSRPAWSWPWSRKRAAS
jgi:hypothetical protein